MITRDLECPWPHGYCAGLDLDRAVRETSKLQKYSSFRKLVILLRDHDVAVEARDYQLIISWLRLGSMGSVVCAIVFSKSIDPFI